MFILGPPRCGTTLLYRCIGSHPDAGYFNRANRKLIAFPRVAGLLTRLGLFADHPRESRKIWDRFLPVGSDAVAGAAEAGSEVREWYERFIAVVLRARGARRFVAKLPSHTVRVPWLKALFPNALFVQALRDWRAAVSSTVVKRHQDHGGRWFGVKASGWREANQEAPEMAAAWQYRVSHEILEAERAGWPEHQFVQVWYEDLCLDPVTVMQEVFEFCGLTWSGKVEAALPRDIRPLAPKWPRHLKPEMINKILERHADVLRRYEHEQMTVNS